MRIHVLALFCALFSASFTAHAAEDGDVIYELEGLRERIAALESSEGNRDCPEACQCCRPGLFTVGKFMVLRPRRSPTPYAGSLNPPSPGNVDGVNFVQNTTLHHTDYDLDPGFRIGVGYVTSACWDFGFDFTNFHGAGDSQIGSPNIDDGVFANLIDREMADAGVDDDLDDGLADVARESLNLDYRVYDLTIGRYFQPACGFRVRLFAGLRAADIEQTSAVLYADFDNGQLSESVVVDRSISMYGLGPQLGAQVHWNVFDSHWGVAGRGSMAMVYGNFSVTRTETQVDLDVNEVDLWRYSFEHNQVIPVVQLALAVRYDCGRFYATAGYEFTHWFGLYQDLDVPGWGQDDDAGDDSDTVNVRSDRADLTLDGWFAEVGVLW